jgi:hypothetical protein
VELVTDGVDHTDYEGTVGSKNTSICELDCVMFLGIATCTCSIEDPEDEANLTSVAIILIL